VMKNGFSKFGFSKWVNWVYCYVALSSAPTPTTHSQKTLVSHPLEKRGPPVGLGHFSPR
jgi:hypothetical protein